MLPLVIMFLIFFSHLTLCMLVSLLKVEKIRPHLKWTLFDSQVFAPECGRCGHFRQLMMISGVYIRRQETPGGPDLTCLHKEEGD